MVRAGGIETFVVGRFFNPAGSTRCRPTGRIGNPAHTSRIKFDRAKYTSTDDDSYLEESPPAYGLERPTHVGRAKPQARLPRHHQAQVHAHLTRVGSLHDGGVRLGEHLRFHVRAEAVYAA